MFLFTDRATRPAEPPAAERVPHAATLSKASEATGVSFGYLAKTAERESGFNPAAKAPTSTASGMFQFLEQTWLGMVKQEGAKFGLAAEAEAITANGGRFGVADPATRQRILDLRADPTASANMAGAFAARNGRQLEEALGRKPKEGELYIAHFLGAAGARDLINLVQSQPSAKAAGAFQDAASANRSVFFDRDGRARSAGEVYANLTGAFDKTATPSAPQAQETAATTDRAYAMFRVKGEGKPLHALFRSNGEPVASAVSEAWAGLGRRGGERGGETRVAFFPTAIRNAGVASDASPAPPLPAPERKAVDIPLPEARPVGLAAGPVQPAAQRRAAAVLKPLDLMRFVRTVSTP